MGRDEYWDECVEAAANDCGAVLTKEQIKYIGGCCAGAHENYGMAFYSPSDGEHYHSQISELKRELGDERNKVHCKTCNGRGRIIENGPVHSYNSECHKCNGEGRHKP